MRRFLAKTAFDYAGIIDASVDHWRRIDAMIEHNRHVPADILLREGAKAAGCIGREGKVHRPLSGVVGIAILRGAAQIGARYDGRAADDIPSLSLLRRASGAALRTPRQKFCTRGQDAAVLAQR